MQHKLRLPQNFRKIGAHNFVIVDPMCFKKSANQCDQLTKIYNREGYRTARYPYNDGFVLYKSVGKILREKPKPKKKKARKPPRRHLSEVIKYQAQKRRTGAWLATLTPRQQKLLVGKNYVIEP